MGGYFEFDYDDGISDGGSVTKLTIDYMASNCTDELRACHHL
ncbi:MAG: hypothetical protein WA667_09835 [Candidatus Nitrosopolaris sp.]